MASGFEVHNLAPAKSFVTLRCAANRDSKLIEVGDYQPALEIPREESESGPYS